MFQQELIKDNFTSLRQIRFDMFNLSLQYFPLGRRPAEYSLQSLWSICIRNLFQLLSFNTAEFWKAPESTFWKTPQPATISKGFQMHRSVQQFSFLKMKWNISLWPKQHGVAKQRMLPPPCGPPSNSRPTFRELTSAITGASPWTTDGTKMLPNLQFTALKEVEFRVPEVWSSCGTLLNFLLKTAEKKVLHVLWFLLYSTLQRCYCVKDVCLQALRLCVQVLSPVTLVR